MVSNEAYFPALEIESEEVNLLSCYSLRLIHPSRMRRVIKDSRLHRLKSPFGCVSLQDASSTQNLGGYCIALILRKRFEWTVLFWLRQSLYNSTTSVDLSYLRIHTATQNVHRKDHLDSTIAQVRRVFEKRQLSVYALDCIVFLRRLIFWWCYRHKGVMIWRAPKWVNWMGGW